MKIIRNAAVLALFALSLTFTACSDKTEPKTKTYYEYFDTVTTVSSYADESAERFEENASAVEECLKKYHRLFDIYYEYSDTNNLKTVNDNAGISPVKVDRALIDFLLYAKEMHTKTGGEMNVAMGAVLKLWHEQRELASSNPEGAALPASDALADAANHIFPDSIIIDEVASTVYISDKDTSLDVGALGKGYAASRAVSLLKDRGAESYVLNLGGNICAIGEKPDGRGWLTGITNPKKDSDNSFAVKLMLSNTSCVTSGDYERYYTVGGKNYHHIIDKDTLYPSEYFSSVTVINPDSAIADALSTALFCMSYEEGIELIESFKNTEVLWIYQNGRMKMTEGMKNLITE